MMWSILAPHGSWFVLDMKPELMPEYTRFQETKGKSMGEIHRGNNNRLFLEWLSTDRKHCFNFLFKVQTGSLKIAPPQQLGYMSQFVSV